MKTANEIAKELTELIGKSHTKQYIIPNDDFQCQWKININGAYEYTYEELQQKLELDWFDTTLNWNSRIPWRFYLVKHDGQNIQHIHFELSYLSLGDKVLTYYEKKRTNHV